MTLFLPKWVVLVRASRSLERLAYLALRRWLGAFSGGNHCLEGCCEQVGATLDFQPGLFLLFISLPQGLLILVILQISLL